jgi:hypothetical protein
LDRRVESGLLNEHADGGPGTVPGWVRLVRRGTSFEALRSSDGLSWTSLGFTQIAMTEQVYVGLAVASQDANTEAMAVIDHFSTATIPPHLPPTVTLVAPLNGATFEAPTTITLTAAASDPENRLAHVDFYRDSTQLGTALAAPYSFTWSSVPAGSYTLTAVAVDADGGTAVSAVGITVTTAPSTTHVVFTASADHDTLVTSYLLEVFASDADVNTSSPIASTDLGKPTPEANSDISVDETSFFNALSPANYLVTVAAVTPEGGARSTPVSFTR